MHLPAKGLVYTLSVLAVAVDVDGRPLPYDEEGAVAESVRSSNHHLISILSVTDR